MQGSHVTWLWRCFRGAPYPAHPRWYPSNEPMSRNFVYASQSSTFHWWPAFTLYLTACKWMLCDSERVSCRRARSHKETRLSPACKRQKTPLSIHMNSSIVFIQRLGFSVHIFMPNLDWFNLQTFWKMSLWYFLQFTILIQICHTSPFCPTFVFNFLMDAEI